MGERAMGYGQKEKTSESLWYLNIFVDPSGAAAMHFKGLLNGGTDNL